MNRPTVRLICRNPSRSGGPKASRELDGRRVVSIQEPRSPAAAAAPNGPQSDEFELGNVVVAGRVRVLVSHETVERVGSARNRRQWTVRVSLVVHAPSGVLDDQFVCHAPIMAEDHS